MKSNRLIAFAVSILIFSVSATAAKTEADHSKDKAFIRNAINKMDVAYAAKDADGYIAYTDPDFADVDLNGKEGVHGKEERHQRLIATFAKATNLDAKITVRSTIRSIAFDKDGATAITDSNTTYSVHVNGQDRVLKDHSTSRDFWVKSSAGWLERRSRTLSSEKTLNGQPTS